MFGTVARMHVKAGRLEELKAVVAGGETRGMEGHLMTAVYQGTDDPAEVWLATVFRDRESYLANADSPPQHEMYERLRALLDADPEWHDGEVVFASEGVAAPARTKPG